MAPNFFVSLSYSQQIVLLYNCTPKFAVVQRHSFVVEDGFHPLFSSFRVLNASLLLSPLKSLSPLFSLQFSFVLGNFFSFLLSISLCLQVCSLALSCYRNQLDVDALYASPRYPDVLCKCIRQFHRLHVEKRGSGTLINFQPSSHKHRRNRSCCSPQLQSLQAIQPPSPDWQPAT